MQGVLLTRCKTFLALVLSCGWFLSMHASAVIPEMDTDELLQPQAPTLQQQYTATQQLKNQPVKALQGSAVKTMTFQEAMATETDVNWYAWYLAVREYIRATGSITECERGTPIKFYKDGRIEALSPDPICQLSMRFRHFPLPAQSRVQTLILPVRAGSLPPASPAEIQKRVQSSPQ